MKPDIVVDVRWSMPPEPMEKVLEALDQRTAGQKVRMLIHREPFPLYPILNQMGLSYKAQLQPDGCFEILIFEPTEKT